LNFSAKGNETPNAKDSKENETQKMPTLIATIIAANSSEVCQPNDHTHD